MFAIKIVIKIVKKIVNSIRRWSVKLSKALTLKPEELEALSKFLIDVAKGILGVPLIAYFVQGFSSLVLLSVFMVDFMIVTVLWIIAIRLSRASKRRLK